MVEEIIRWSDAVITTFDTLPPRLVVQLACNKYNKPLMDLAVGGPQDAEIRIWARRNKACIACYVSGITGLSKQGSRRAIYASDPRIADLVADIALIYLERVLMGGLMYHRGYS